jgi:hypothetical protein
MFHLRKALHVSARKQARKLSPIPYSRALRTVCVLLLGLFVFTCLPAAAQLARFGPIDPSNGFPTWYQDKTGLTLDLCLPQTQAEMTWCLLPPIPNGIPPEVFPTNWAIENFYADASAGGTQQGASIKLVIDLETSFANGFNVVPGDQIVFGRTRIKISPLPFDGTYVVYTPVGRFQFDNQLAGDKIFFTEDIGLAAVGNFSAALNGRVGPFLLPSTTPGGVELPPMPGLQPGQDPFFDAIAAAGGATPLPNNGRKYIADPARLGPITGGKTMLAGQAVYTVNDGTTRDPNIFRVEGPSGFVFETTQFNVMGRTFEGAIAGDVAVKRASYARTATGATSVDVYATAAPNTQGRIPAGPAPVTTATHLSFFDAPCTATLNAAGNPGPPYSAPAVGGVATQLLNAGTVYSGESNPAAPPLQVCVESNAVNAAGQTITTFTPADVTDQIFITSAVYDKTNQAMSVSASSSDLQLNPSLTVIGYGAIPASGTLTVSSLLAAPDEITVLSSASGSNRMQMSYGAVAGATPPALPVANNDTASMFENCSPTATTTACAAPGVTIPVLANDSNAAGGAITIVSGGALGTATLNADGVSIDYTPRLNAFGTETLTYHVTVGTQLSNDASVTITINHVNQAPTAVNDSTGALRSVSNSFNPLTNDTDPDGSADLASIVIVTGNASLGIPAGPVAGGVVTFTPPSTTAAGTYSFTYRAVDSVGNLSANTATVSVILSTAEAIVPAKAIYTQAKGRWTLSGTDAPIAGQTITMKYVDGKFKVNGVCPANNNAAGTVVGTAVVDATGNWLYDQLLNSTAGVLNPSNTLGNSSGFWCTPPKTIIFSSSLSSGTATLAISLK